MTGDLLDRPQCVAKSKRSGERCKRRPIRGGTVCSMHGGKAPAVKAAAEQRQAEAAADAAVAKLLWVGLDQATPVKDPIGLLERLAGALEQMTDVVGSRVNELRGVGGGEHLTQLRAEVVLLEKLLGHLRAVGTDMARLGLAERQVELAQGQAQLVVQAFLSALSVLDLLPVQRDEALAAFLRGLGRGPELVVGELVAQ